MRSKSIILIVFFALILAAVASGMVTIYLKKQVTEAKVTPLLEPVVASVADLSFGHTLKDADLKILMYPKESVPKGAVSQIDSLIGKSTKVFLAEGEPVLVTKLSDVGGGLSLKVEPPYRAVSIKVDKVSGVSGFVLPGDRVDVIVIVSRIGSSGDAKSRTILQNIEVLAAGEETEKKGSEPVLVQAVTLLVDGTGAEKLALSQNEGKLHLALRNPNDTDILAETDGLSKSELLSGPKKEEAPRPKPQVVTKPAPKQPERAPSGRDSLTIILGKDAKKAEPAMQTPKPETEGKKPGE